jgi:release factor glutamine methyltransferase
MSDAQEGGGNVAEPALRLDTLLQACVAQLRTAPAAEVRGGAELDAQLLLAALARVTRSTLLAHGERSLPASELPRLRALLTRRAAGEPLAYLLGEREFWSLPLRVTPAVLVPRPETELLVERALALLPQPVAAVLDLGTGSGAIALALASERPGWQLTATDVSPAALAIARDNAQRLGLQQRVQFCDGDWFAALARPLRFAAIVGNPPYVDALDPALAALQWEPQLALVAAQRGLAALRDIVRDAPRHLQHGGWLLLEHGATQAGEVAALLVERGFARVRSHRDLAGLDRVTEARWAPRAEESP